jgi:alkylhydroperoxidase family enzyme
MPRGKLSRRESEIVILRVAHLTHSAYEFEHHVRMGRRAGLGEEEIDRITRPMGEGRWSPRESAILIAVDRLHSERDLDEATWESLRAQLDERECIELLMLAGHYEMLSTFLNTLRVPLDQARRS